MPMADCKPLPPLSEKDIKRFWSKVAVQRPDDCWLWTAATANGYGYFWAYDNNVRAHKVALFLKTGIDPFPSEVCHACDKRYAIGDLTNRRCCNPFHLFPGTRQDNHADMVAKNRQAFGKRHGNVKLNEQDVLDIRRIYSEGGISQRRLGEQFLVTESNIQYIVRRRTWTSLP